MNFYLPIAEISINIYLLISLGVGIGFISGLFGIGGGFISSPLLILVGIPPSVAVGTTTVQVFASTSTGVISHYQKKNIDYQMGITLVSGGLIGTLCGVLLLNKYPFMLLPIISFGPLLQLELIIILFKTPASSKTFG